MYQILLIYLPILLGYIEVQITAQSESEIEDILWRRVVAFDFLFRITMSFKLNVDNFVPLESDALYVMYREAIPVIVKEIELHPASVFSVKGNESEHLIANVAKQLTTCKSIAVKCLTLLFVAGTGRSYFQSIGVRNVTRNLTDILVDEKDHKLLSDRDLRIKEDQILKQDIIEFFEACLVTATELQECNIAAEIQQITLPRLIIEAFKFGYSFEWFGSLNKNPRFVLYCSR